MYEALDPGQCVTARTPSGEIIGVCFSHERETHVAVGIVATSPDAAERGLAKRMMSVVLDKAQRLKKPARLVSSLMNLKSFSLYKRIGFVPGTIFQDMLIAVPEQGMPESAPARVTRLREAVMADLPQIADFEFAQQGIRREKDLAFFLSKEFGVWRVLVSESEYSAIVWIPWHEHASKVFDDRSRSGADEEAAVEDFDTLTAQLQEQIGRLKVEFSTITLQRDNQDEQHLLKMLLGSESDLATLDEPLAFPVFGRGRVLYALVGEGINDKMILSACQFMVGACSCQVKAQNPGFDLLTQTDWEAAVGDIKISDPLPDTTLTPILLPIPPGRKAKAK